MTCAFEDGKERPILTDMDVATIISLEDDPTLPASTFRMRFVGIGLSCFGTVLGQIFVRPSLRFDKTNLTQLDIKKHVATTIFSTTAAEFALAISILFAEDDLYYSIQVRGINSAKNCRRLLDSHPNAAVENFTLIDSQVIRYGPGGIMRSFFVYPRASSFPTCFLPCSFSTPFTRQEDISPEKMRPVLLEYLRLGRISRVFIPDPDGDKRLLFGE
ncbi:uncharacterized protein BT62DRAFT_1009304 [Guyanagaster necrorhizus]|uniref:Uncharacterized protein n=1 Tax=Guyanagaster necrorhizus TaxID=856835 RepID=A0A9P7VNB7_9AGAR|nr:uncharacterized protein BT62DRAFT_1009304 [Guyanagaster necrorhizus MCA 3950]KAG7443490.1 hypothetical protein BT62DRAFT_1009304 [Guyanagaster necrorhizus MCA 3950]